VSGYLDGDSKAYAARFGITKRVFQLPILRAEYEAAADTV